MAPRVLRCHCRRVGMPGVTGLAQSRSMMLPLSTEMPLLLVLL